MIDYLVKSGLCLIILFAVYHFLLEKENMHRFNRFYLIASLLFGLLVPLITIGYSSEVIKPIEIPIAVANIIQEVPPPQASISFNQSVSEPSPDYPSLILIAYIGATTLLLSRFLFNVYKIVIKICRNPRIHTDDAEIVLLNEKAAPHSFLKYIFLNKDEYLKEDIKEQIVIHELTHVRQKHSIDILVAEILKIVFWFNPVFILYKKAIQLNHEFLADESVITSKHDISQYQLLLLQAAGLPVAGIASYFNYSLTKKRLKKMKKHTSKSRIVLIALSLIPVLAASAFLFSSYSVAPTLEKEIKKSIKSNSYVESLSVSDKLEPKATEQGLISVKTESISVADSVYGPEKVQVQPQFPGATEGWAQFIKGFVVPARAVENKLSGKVYVQFIIELDGSLSNITVLRDVGYDTGAEAVRLLKTSPKWVPGIKDGKPVRVKYTVPVAVTTSPTSTDATPQPTSWTARTSTDVVNMDVVQVRPQFPGGTESWVQFLKGLKIPEAAVQNKASGKVYIRFIVEIDGSLSNFEIIRDIGYETGEEAIRLLATSPKWKAGIQDGKPVRVSYVQPIQISAN